MKQGDVTTQDESVILPVNFIGTFSRDNTLANGTQGVTGIGFRPSSVIFLAVIFSTGAVSIGFDNNGQHNVILNKHEEAADQWSAQGVFSISMFTGVAGANGADIVSMDVDGFTVTWSKTGSPTGTSSIFFMASK